MLKQLKSYIITGLLVLVPFAATAAVIWKAFGFFDGWIWYFGIHIPGAGIVVLLSVLILTGVLTRNYVGKKTYQLADLLMRKVPLVSTIYTTFREVSKTLLDHDKHAFQAVVSLQFLGHHTIGFVTGDTPTQIVTALDVITAKRDVKNINYKMVYVMQAFSPAAGYILMVPEAELQKVDMSIEAAMKLVLTGGMVKSDERAPTEIEGVIEQDGKPKFRVSISEINK